MGDREGEWKKEGGGGGGLLKEKLNVQTSFVHSLRQIMKEKLNPILKSVKSKFYEYKVRQKAPFLRKCVTSCFYLRDIRTTPFSWKYGDTSLWD